MSRFILMLVCGFFAAGCNTISGAGQDVEAVGDAVEEAAEETKEKMSEQED